MAKFGYDNSRKQSSMDGQNSDEMGAKDQLVNIAANQTNPYDAKASDFPDGKTSANVGTGQGSGATWENPNVGKDGLVPQNKNQEGPRNAETVDSSASNESMLERMSAVRANFKTGTNTGESASRAVSPDLAESVNISTGQIEVKGYSKSRVDEVSDRQVKLG